MKKSTFVCYVDFSKAYDKIDRQILWNKIENIGIRGNMLNAIKSLYKNVKCAVRVNNYTTDWFNVDIGVKQGCLLSTTAFNMYINDLSVKLDHMNIGIKVDGKNR